MEVPIAYWNKYHYSLLKMVGNSSIKVCSMSSLPSDGNRKGGTGEVWSSKLHGSKLLLIWKLVEQLVKFAGKGQFKSKEVIQKR